jgi:hypothetical protein
MVVSVYLTFGVISKGGSVKTKFAHLGLGKLIIFIEILKKLKKLIFHQQQRLLNHPFGFYLI